jgi:hypothetical protein
MDIQNYLPTKVISPRANALGENNVGWVIKLFGFQIFLLLGYPMKVIPETRRTY